MESLEKAHERFDPSLGAFVDKDSRNFAAFRAVVKASGFSSPISALMIEASAAHLGTSIGYFPPCCLWAELSVEQLGTIALPTTPPSDVRKLHKSLRRHMQQRQNKPSPAQRLAAEKHAAEQDLARRERATMTAARMDAAGIVCAELMQQEQRDWRSVKGDLDRLGQMVDRVLNADGYHGLAAVVGKLGIESAAQLAELTLQRLKHVMRQLNNPDVLHAQWKHTWEEAERQRAEKGNVAALGCGGSAQCGSGSGGASP